MRDKVRIFSVLLVLSVTFAMGAVAAEDSGNVWKSSTEQVNIKNNNSSDTTEQSDVESIEKKINQQQFQRQRTAGEIDTLEEFLYERNLVAGVYENTAFSKYEPVKVNEVACDFWTNAENAVDDIVLVTNYLPESGEEFYVRTVFAFPVFSDGETHLHLNFHKTGHVDADALEDKIITEINGQRYWLYAYNYEGKLAPGETTEPSLLEYVFDKDVTTELFDEFGDNYQVLITSQAVQVTGFSTLADAFGKTFYNVTAQNHPWKDVISDVELTSVQ